MPPLAGRKKDPPGKKDAPARDADFDEDLPDNDVRLSKDLSSAQAHLSAVDRMGSGSLASLFGDMHSSASAGGGLSAPLQYGGLVGNQVFGSRASVGPKFGTGWANTPKFGSGWARGDMVKDLFLP